MLKVGDKVPVFSLMDTERNEFTNANIEGKREIEIAMKGGYDWKRFCF